MQGRETISIEASLVLQCLMNQWRDISTLCNTNGNNVIYAQRAIADDTGLSVYRVKKALNELKAKNYIVSEARYCRLAERYYLMSKALESG